MCFVFSWSYTDLFGIPDFAAGGMENWGLITYSEDSLLYNSTEDSERRKQRVNVVIAHELAHQVPHPHLASPLKGRSILPEP